MKTSPKTLFYITTLTGLGLEILSYLVFKQPVLELIMTSLIALTVLILTLRDLRYGLWCIIGELALASQGYLFSLHLGTFVLSLRMLVWILVIAVWLGREVLAVLRKEAVVKKYRDLPYARPLMALGAVLLLGLLVGFLVHNDQGLYILESKRWMYSIIIIPFLLTFKTKEDIKQLAVVIAGMVTVLCLQTLFLIYIFSHALVPLVYDIYAWMRGDLLGEITRLPNGFARVFMQSQIFVLPALAGAYVFGYEAWTNSRKKVWWYGVLGSISLATVIASLSRSFWVALAVSGVLTAVLFCFLHRPKLGRLARFVAYGIGGVIVSFGMLWIVVRFPFPRSQALLDVSLLSDRATKLEAGAASRWSLLPVMWQGISHSPLWGYGFGKTLTYTTSDPRIVSSTVNGEFTTYAFEWGWLDIWLKFGLLGTIAYIWLLWSIWRDSYQVMKVKPLVGSVLVMTVIIIAVVHFFTPYLNHPLGFGYLAVLMAAAASYREACRFPKSIV